MEPLASTLPSQSTCEQTNLARLDIKLQREYSSAMHSHSKGLNGVMGSAVVKGQGGGGGGVMQWHQLWISTAGLLVTVGTAIGKVGALAQHPAVADTDIEALGSNGLHTCLVSAMEQPSLPTISQLRSSFLQHATHLLLPWRLCRCH